MVFKSRSEAGKKLVKLLGDYKNQNTVVYALPRGGVVVGAEIAKALNAPLDLIITRKIGHPNQPELAIAATSENGILVIDPEYKQLTQTYWFTQALENEKSEAKRRREKYLKGKLPLLCDGKTAIIVDDGVATGLTLKAAIKEIRKFNPKEIIIALPVIPDEVALEIEPEVVRIVALERPVYFKGSVGAYFQDFSQVSDEEVKARLL